MSRVLILATTTGYQTRSFGQAADTLGVELVFATDRCQQLDDPWRDGAIAIRFHEEERSTDTIVEEARARRMDGVVALGDRPTVIAAMVNERLGFAGHPPAAAAISRNKRLTREALTSAGLPAPWFVPVRAGSPIPPVDFPCVVKPLALSGSRGVIRADDRDGLERAIARVRAVLAQPDVRAMRDEVNDDLLVEGFIPGREYALDGLMERGRLRTLAVFEKPEPLDGPFFEETIYVSLAAGSLTAAIEEAVGRAADAIGLRHGPIHAECRVNERGIFVLEVAARPIGGLCARALRFVHADGGDRISLEHLVLLHALGEDVSGFAREAPATGVMMIPIPARGVYRRVDGLEGARQVDYIDEVRITAKPDQTLVPLPEGASYLGFIFAHAAVGNLVERALREAHARLRFVIDRDLVVRPA